MYQGFITSNNSIGNVQSFYFKRLRLSKQIVTRNRMCSRVKSLDTHLVHTRVILSLPVRISCALPKEISNLSVTSRQLLCDLLKYIFHQLIFCFPSRMFMAAHFLISSFNSRPLPNLKRFLHLMIRLFFKAPSS